MYIFIVCIDWLHRSVKSAYTCVNTWYIYAHNTCTFSSFVSIDFIVLSSLHMHVWMHVTYMHIIHVHFLRLYRLTSSFCPYVCMSDSCEYKHWWNLQRNMNKTDIQTDRQTDSTYPMHTDNQIVAKFLSALQKADMRWQKQVKSSVGVHHSAAHAYNGHVCMSFYLIRTGQKLRRRTPLCRACI